MIGSAWKSGGRPCLCLVHGHDLCRVHSRDLRRHVFLVSPNAVYGDCRCSGFPVNPLRGDQTQF